MKISYNWLKHYIDIEKSPAEVAVLLTDCGLEVESVEPFQSLKGGLQGLLIGEVMQVEKHPDADKLSITKVNIGSGEILNIVCGAPNVAAGQKVIVATVGAKLFPTQGEPFEIKKSKIRGALSEGMICAEDEIGLGDSHDGILVLDATAQVGTAAADYFKIDNDFIFEIGLTPNRADAASHIGVARDLNAVMALLNGFKSIPQLKLPDVSKFKVNNKSKCIEVKVEDFSACPRYSGVSLSGIVVADSPDWLKNKLKAIGLRPINNIVDVTNFVLQETGQPLHAFDLDKISGSKICVKKLAESSKFKTLDGIERELSAEDLMICDDTKALCMAGVFGGLDSGVNESTTSVFLESAYFNSVSVRKTAKRHALKTDASFRFERGTDPNMCFYALQRAALLIQEIAGGEISMEPIDLYPNKIENFSIPFSYKNCARLIGKTIEKETIKNIFLALGIGIEKEDSEWLQLNVPAYKVDVQREVDAIEEVLRIYGYNQIELPTQVNSSLSFASKPDREKIQNTVSDLLSSTGFAEIMSLSLSPSSYTQDSKLLLKENAVAMLNPLSSDLDVLRQTLLYSGLEAIAYNQNRKRSDVKFYEFGKSYHRSTKQETGENFYTEKNHLALFLSGNKSTESWTTQANLLSFYSLKAAVNSVLNRLGITHFKETFVSNEILSTGLSYEVKQKKLVEFGLVSKAILKKMDIKSAVFFAEFDWDALVKLSGNNTITYTELPKFPEVRRDLALLLNAETTYTQVQEIAFQSEKKLLKAVNLFDVYEGEKLAAGKKSYAVSFILQDENSTLNDSQIDKIMEKLIETYKEKLGASLR